ncbi:PadR family transcriptional regulator [Arthrobacter flavus]|uniref:PadR family transcriptional regulator n=1 Tax=Arthrobacter flavus TaxID=95172 RepID=A0ABW4Q8F3_9MICC
MARDLTVEGVVRSALPIAILAALKPQATHGYALIELLSTQGFSDVKGGTLYPILARLEQQGLVRSAWDHSQSGPGRKMFTTTTEGDRLVDAATKAWQDMGQTLKNLSTLGVVQS